MKKKKSALFLQKLYHCLLASYGPSACPLNHGNPFQLLAAVMLSAQCRDDRVNAVTPALFQAAPDARAMARLSEEEIAGYIHTLGLYRSKSRNLKLAAEEICLRHHGEVPRTMEELTKLAGIGRKSANVLLGNAFHTPGFPVDTHVKRLLKRIGFTASDRPETIEKEVNALLAEDCWTEFSHLLIRHGRAICHAAKPACEQCIIADFCARKGVKP